MRQWRKNKNQWYLRKIMPNDILSYSRKNPNREIELCVGTWKFQRYWRKIMWKFQGSVQMDVEFPGVFKKNSCSISLLQGLHFWIWNFQGIIWYSVTLSGNFAEFPGVRACFLCNVSGWSSKSKNSRTFLQKSS